jgi:hypothetical protein
MAAFNKFNTFALALTEKKHNLTSDTLVIALTNTVPVATNAVLADITQISYTNLSSRTVTTTSNTQSSGTEKLILVDLVLTASGAVATFRYAVLYNDTATNDELIGWWDYGSAITMANGETFTVDFDGTNGVLQIV